MKYAVIYQSKSGNTRLIAEKIYGALNTEDKTIVDIDTEQDIPAADVYLIGFGIHGYSCSMDISDVFEQITGGKYAVFVTCGYVPTEQYKEKLEKNLVGASIHQEIFGSDHLVPGRGRVSGNVSLSGECGVR